MTINLDTEIVATYFDTKSGNCSYTIERNGKRWTASVHVDQFNQHDLSPGGQQRRRDHLARALEDAMRGMDDETKALTESAVEETVYTFDAAEQA
jgi:DNA-binding protein YbaB